MKTADRKTQITVKRTNGNIEVVLHDNIALATVAGLQKQVIEATKKAGKGDIIKFELVEVEREMTAKEEKLHKEQDKLAQYDALQRKIMEH